MFLFMSITGSIGWLHVRSINCPCAKYFSFQPKSCILIPFKRSWVILRAWKIRLFWHDSYRVFHQNVRDVNNLTCISKHVRKLYTCVQLYCVLVGRRFSLEKSHYSPGFSSGFLVGTFVDYSSSIFSRRILSKWARLLRWQVFFFFFRQTTECMRSGHFLQNY